MRLFKWFCRLHQWWYWNNVKKCHLCFSLYQTRLSFVKVLHGSSYLPFIWSGVKVIGSFKTMSNLLVSVEIFWFPRSFSPVLIILICCILRVVEEERLGYFVVWFMVPNDVKWSPYNLYIIYKIGNDTWEQAATRSSKFELAHSLFNIHLCVKEITFTCLRICMSFCLDDVNATWNDYPSVSEY